MALFKARGRLRLSVRRKHGMKTGKNNCRGQEMLLTLISQQFWMSEGLPSGGLPRQPAGARQAKAGGADSRNLKELASFHYSDHFGLGTPCSMHFLDE